MEIVFYIGIVLFVLFGPWILLWRVNSRRKSDRLEDQSRWAEVTSRIHALERELKELRSQGSTQTPQVRQQEVTAPPPASTPPPQRMPVAPAVPQSSSQAAAEAWVTGKGVEVPRVLPSPTAPA